MNVAPDPAVGQAEPDWKSSGSRDLVWALYQFDGSLEERYAMAVLLDAHRGHLSPDKYRQLDHDTQEVIAEMFDCGLLEMMDGSIVIPFKIPPKVERKRRPRRNFRHLLDDECAWCQSTEDLQIDHVIPLSRGGPDEEENTRTLCRTCNMFKSNRLDEEIGR